MVHRAHGKDHIILRYRKRGAGYIFHAWGVLEVSWATTMVVTVINCEGNAQPGADEEKPACELTNIRATIGLEFHDRF
jgi:hypothetical protein